MTRYLLMSALTATLTVPPVDVAPTLKIVVDMPPGVARAELVATAVGEGAEPIRLEALAGAEVSLPLPSDRSWILGVKARGAWCQQETVTAERLGRLVPLILRCYPVGALGGRLPQPTDPRVGAGIRARFFPATGHSGKQTPSGEVPCLVEENRFRCELPAAHLDVQLRSVGLVPFYAWGIEVRPGAHFELGAVQLRPGASVSGFVESRDQRAPVPGCRLQLLLESVDRARDPALRQRLESLSSSAATDERGFFQFAAVASGFYELLAECEGYAAARITSIEVVEGLESQLDGSLLVGKPLKLVVTVLPSADPYGEPWTVVLDRLRGSKGAPTKRQEGKVDAEGVWVATGLAPAEYHLRILSGDERWVEREIRLEAGDGSEVLEVPLVEVRGVAEIGEEPMTGTLWFGGTRGSRRVRLAVDLEGRFEGYLPEEGPWWVEWLPDSRDPGGFEIGEVEVRRSPGKSYVELEIELPGTRLRGTVVDEQDAGVADIDVQVNTLGRSKILRRGPRATARSGRDGSFEFLGLPPGQLTLSASDPARDLESDIELVTLAEATEPPHHRVVVRKKRLYSGQVLAGSGPVAGARIHAFGDLVSSAGTAGEEAVSGPDGSFELLIRGSATWLYFVVSAPGKATRLARVTADPTRPIVLELSDHGGDLVLRLPPGLRNLEALGRTVLLHGDAFLHAAMLSLITGQPGPLPADGQIQLRNLEPGLYRVCSGAGVFSQVRQGAQPPQASCVDGLVQPFSTLELVVPGPDAGR